jgi:hypothetical protein
MEVRHVPPTEWRFVYACGHQLRFTAPRTPDELLRVTDWMEQYWSTCSQCPRPHTGLAIVVEGSAGSPAQP